MTQAGPPREETPGLVRTLVRSAYRGLEDSEESCKPPCGERLPEKQTPKVQEVGEEANTGDLSA